MKSPKKKSVYIIIPVYNRKEITLNCLEILNSQGLLHFYHIVVVDDGSIDGTQAAITSLYSDITVLSGDGNLWWTGAIKKGMEYAYQQGADYFIWLNDDTVPLNNTIPLMVSECTQNPQKIVSAQCYDNLALETQTYGGQKKKGFSINLIAADKNQVLDCDCMSGNLVCFPRSVIDKIGFPPNDKLPHCLADIDYTWTAKQAGYQLEVLGNAIAICEFNHFEGSWINNPLPMKERWKIINSPKSNLYPPAYWYHCQNIHGFLGIFPFTRTYIRLIILTLARIIFPLKFLQTIKAIKDKRKKFDNF